MVDVLSAIKHYRCDVLVQAHKFSITCASRILVLNQMSSFSMRVNDVVEVTIRMDGRSSVFHLPQALFQTANIGGVEEKFIALDSGSNALTRLMGCRAPIDERQRLLSRSTLLEEMILLRDNAVCIRAGEGPFQSVADVAQMTRTKKYWKVLANTPAVVSITFPMMGDLPSIDMNVFGDIGRHGRKHIVVQCTDHNMSWLTAAVCAQAQMREGAMVRRNPESHHAKRMRATRTGHGPVTEASDQEGDADDDVATAVQNESTESGVTGGTTQMRQTSLDAMWASVE